MYYKDKLTALQRVFGTQDIALEEGYLIAGGVRYPVINEVIVVTDPSQYTPAVKAALAARANPSPDRVTNTAHYAQDIQYTFGEEWKQYQNILPEHKKEFSEYFDIVDLDGLKDKMVCDLGCGNGRWSFFVKDRCKELMLVDFSDAIFVARKNLAASSHCLFFMGDIQRLPFAKDFADFIFCLGVLHHLPSPCLGEVRKLKKYAPSLLIFLYYSLDNRPFYFRFILSMVTVARRLLCTVRNETFRKMFSLAGTFFLYMPLVIMGKLLKPLGLSSNVPLYDAYHDKGVARIEQDVYDRFFTRIEQRVSRKQIKALHDTFAAVTISGYLPYHHFLCKR